MSLAEGDQAARALLAWFAEDRVPADDNFFVGFAAGEEARQARVAEAEELLTAVATLRLMPAVDGAIWRGKFAAWLRLAPRATSKEP